MSTPAISVVMPVYNGEKYLREAIDSILGQTFKDFEFIIVNDGSTDLTEEIILSYDDPRIVYLKNEKNVGICTTLNIGLKAARGEFIARMDADDISLPKRFHIQVNYLNRHPSIGVLGTDVVLFGNGMSEHDIRLVHSTSLCQMGLIFNSCCAHPSVMIRKSVLDNQQIRYRDEFRGLEDYVLWWEMSRVTEIANVPKTLLKYRIHPSQITQNYTSEFLIKTRSFFDMRMHDINVDLSSEQSEALFCYCTSQFYGFSKEHLYHLIDACKVIYDSYNVSERKNKKALRVTLAQIVLAAVQKSGLQTSESFAIRQIRQNGIMPLSLYLKVLFFKFKKKIDD